MQRNDQGQPPRHKPDTTQAMAGQPRTDEEDDELQQPDNVPSFLTAKELQARGPSKGGETRSGPDPFEKEDEDEKPAKKPGK
jgi:hypothetical protein